MNYFFLTILEYWWVFLLIIIKVTFYYKLIDVSFLKKGIVFYTSSIIFLLIGVFSLSNNKYANIMFIVIYSLITLWMFIDANYFCYFNQTASINQLFQLNSLFVVNESVRFSMPPKSVFLFGDIPFIYYMLKNIVDEKSYFGYTVLGIILIIAVFYLLIVIAINKKNKKLFTIINHTEFFAYHIKDIIINIFGSFLKDKTTEENVDNLISKLNQERKNDKNQYYGVGKGKNLIVIQLESVQNFVVNKKYNGQEITPNLNKLIKDNSLYFDNFYQNIGRGNTSDAEFSVNNSLYPVIEGESYRLYEKNTFEGLPWLMRDEGYKSLAIHGYKKEFWNRDKAYINQGFERFISEEDFDINEKIGFGISDKEMFSQAADKLAEIREPFYSMIISLSNHHPYLLPKKMQTIKLKKEDEGSIFGNYIQSIRYTDEALGNFIEKLKLNNLYDQSVIAIYGDHHGLNCKDIAINKKMSEFLGYNYDYEEMLNIPLIIRIPNLDETRKIETVGGHIDFMPTIMNIMGIDLDKKYVFGRDIINRGEGFVASITYMLEGSFIKNGVIFEMSRDGIFENSRAWDINTKEPVPLEKLREDYEKAANLLINSKYILDKDLIKYKPKS